MQNQNQEYSSRSASAISFEDISEFVYNSLVSLEGTNEQYESDSSELYINFDIQLSQNNNELIKDYTTKQLKELSDRIIFLIEKGDGYSWIYKSQNLADHLNLIYWCNCRIELGKHRSKVSDINKQRDTSARLERYDCKG
ncbi:7749_t:CDS:1, partial [Cetraspora pellucida]